ncbi:hypothetical protein Baya_13457 [Bagarius yarrelli]|uniref:Uncharacterized protein n=1 Tax=Bagarius yarrelli TaxID=175774 RepID=A0A556V6J1_BAGYA|nr:hypothetical protein Baya_13457 [Bagarius yarrelli]
MVYERVCVCGGLGSLGRGRTVRVRSSKEFSGSSSVLQFHTEERLSSERSSPSVQSAHLHQIPRRLEGRGGL